MGRGLYCPKHDREYGIFPCELCEEQAMTPPTQAETAPVTDEAKAAWRRVYMDTMIKHAGLTEEQASDAYEAGTDFYDYSDDPKMAAIDEMECWTDDGDAE